jgi:hypothetical protein
MSVSHGKDTVGVMSDSHGKDTIGIEFLFTLKGYSFYKTFLGIKLDYDEHMLFCP